MYQEKTFGTTIVKKKLCEQPVLGFKATVSTLYTYILNKLKYLICSRVFVKDGLSRDHGLHSRDHLPTPNHSAPQTKK